MKYLLSCLFLLLVFAASAQDARIISREAFTVKYPAAWHIDTADSDYDPDALFSLDAPDGNSMVMFIIMDIAVDNDEMLQAQVKEFTSQLIKKPTSQTPFTRWGNLTGKGMEIKGKLMGVYKGAVRIFTWTDGEKSMVIVTQYYDQHFSNIEKDIRLIETSFSFK